MSPQTISTTIASILNLGAKLFYASPNLVDILNFFKIDKGVNYAQVSIS